jgi:predicted nuclease with TOPRIM domain
VTAGETILAVTGLLTLLGGGIRWWYETSTRHLRRERDDAVKAHAQLTAQFNAQQERLTQLRVQATRLEAVAEDGRKAIQRAGDLQTRAEAAEEAYANAQLRILSLQGDLAHAEDRYTDFQAFRDKP